MTKPNIQDARAWADWSGTKLGVAESHRYALAAAEIIQSLPDHWIDAEKLREVIEEYDSWESGAFIDDLRALLTPSLPSLADLIEQGNDPQKYVGMQCIMHDFPSTRVITKVRDSRVSALREDLEIQHATISKVTPLPDLPRLEWPSLSLSGESEDVSLETETNTEGGAPGVYDDGGPLLPGSQRINLVGARKLPPLADTIPDQVVAKDACNNTVPQSGDVWQAVWLDRAGILVVGKGIDHESGSLQGYFFMDHDPQVRWVGTDEVDLTKLVLRRGQ